MLGINRWWQIWRSLVSSVMVAVLVLSLVSCGDRAETSQIPNSTEKSKIQIGGAISEVSPPEAIQQLQPTLDIYKPQVSILSPKSDEVLPDTKVTARFQVQDLPIFKNPDLGMGPHLEVILDNHPYTMVYDLNQPLVLQDLDPGTHTLQVFAARPWHESFKNEGAYAQTRFHILTKTAENNPNPDLPLLTYSRPTVRVVSYIPSPSGSFSSNSGWLTRLLKSHIIGAVLPATNTPLKSFL